MQPRFIVDATGRSAAFARAHGSFVHGEDRQIALVAVGGNRIDPDQSGGRVLIESVETGWWYFAPLSAGRCVCMFVTDADLLPDARRRVFRRGGNSKSNRTSHVRSRVAQYSRLADPIVRCARSQRLDRFAGVGWFAVGDAAMAFDLLSSRGIGKAVEQGHRAAHAIDAHLSGDREALRDYCDALERGDGNYRRTRVSYYNIERRWPGAEFWQRRQTTTDDGAMGSGVFNPF